MPSFWTDTGLANIITAWQAHANRPRFLQWGEGSGQGVGDNAIDDPGDTNENRTEGTTSIQQENVANDTFQVVGTIVANGPRTITEVGVFDAAGSGNPPTGGNMDLYADFPVINLDAGDSIQFTVRLTVIDGNP